MKSTCLIVALVGMGFLSSLTVAADWPQWRRPERDGVSKETGLLKQWPSDGPKLLWQVKDIGHGFSTPAVVGERIYLISNEGTDDEYVQAPRHCRRQTDLASHIGKVGPNKGPQYPAARSTPTVDGELLYALGSDGDLACLETATGKVRWQKNLRTDFGGQPGDWAYAESPLVDGSVLVVTPGGSQATIVALYKQTGEAIWKSEVPEGDQAAYASAIVVDAVGVKQYVQFLQKGLVGVDAKSGKFLWRYGRTAEGSPANIPTPVAHNDLVYSSAGRSGGGLVKLKADQGAVEAEQVYFEQKLPTSIGGAVEVGGDLYGTMSQGLVCATLPRARSSGKIAASVPAPSAMPTAACTYIAKKTTWRWSRPRPTATTSWGNSRFPISRSEADPQRKLGRIRWWQTAGCTSAIWGPCGATTSRPSERRADYARCGCISPG